METFSSKFHLPDSDPPCEVQLPHNLTKDQLLSFPAFRNWLNSFRHNLSLQRNQDHTFHDDPYRLRAIEVESATWFSPEMLGFVKIQARITTDTGGSDGWLPGAVFLRGRSVAMMIILQPDDGNLDTEDDKYVILTVQPRIAATSFALAELPAGMLDNETKNVKGKAVDEIREETELEFDQSELIDMTELAVSQASKQLWKKAGTENMAESKGVPSISSYQKQSGASASAGVQTSQTPSSATYSHHSVPCESNTTEVPSDEVLQNEMYPSPGACDESISLFLCQKQVPRAELDGLKGKLTGLRHEGEKITLKLVPLKDLWKEGARDAKALSALALYEALRREGRLPNPSRSKQD